LEEFGIKYGRVEEVFEEDQGSCRAVEPLMMMMKTKSRTGLAGERQTGSVFCSSGYTG
jgi:hypothetical protein